MKQKYVHGYTRGEKQRLSDQSRTLREILFDDTSYGAGEHVLEVGCGTGAQTDWLVSSNPETQFRSIDIDHSSLMDAKARCKQSKNVTFSHADCNDLPYSDSQFDHVFICFVLEHLRDPLNALSEAFRILKPGGTITVIEGDHDSVLMHPDNSAARAVIRAQVSVQSRAFGNATIGRRLFPILDTAGFVDLFVSPRIVYADASRPDLVNQFVEKTFTQMIAGVRDRAINQGIISDQKFDLGLRALRRTQESDGVFAYTFFKAVGVKPKV